LLEIREILNALVASKKMIDEVQLPDAAPISEQQLHAYMRLKRKKLNYKMLILTDCIALEEPLPEGLLDFVQKMSEVYELRGVAYKDLQLTPEVVLPKMGQNNLYRFWLIYTRGKKAVDGTSPFLRTEFFRFIEDHCTDLMEKKYRLRESPYFDDGVFDQTMRLIETYYKLDPQLSLLAQRSKPKL